MKKYIVILLIVLTGCNSLKIPDSRNFVRYEHINDVTVYPIGTNIQKRSDRKIIKSLFSKGGHFTNQKIAIRKLYKKDKIAIYALNESKYKRRGYSSHRIRRPNNYRIAFKYPNVIYSVNWSSDSATTHREFNSMLEYMNKQSIPITEKEIEELRNKINIILETNKKDFKENPPFP
jgi:hypothetical protein